MRIKWVILLVMLVGPLLASPGNRVVNKYKDLQKTLMKLTTSPLVNLLLVFDSAATKGPIVDMMDSIAEKRKGYMEIRIIDCNTNDKEMIAKFPYCQEETRKHLPALMFSEPHLNLKTDGQVVQPTMKPYQGSLDEKKLFNFAVPLMPIYSVQLRNQRDLNKFKEKYSKTPTIIYLTDKEKIPPFYRALTANFRSTIAFAHCSSKSPLAESLKIKQFPTFLLNGKQPIPVESKLQQMIERLQMIQGQQTQIIIHEYQNSKLTELTVDNLEELVHKKQEHILIHFPSIDGTQHPEWPKAQKKFSKMFSVYEATSVPQQYNKLKQKINVKQTPSIIYFPKSLVKKNVQKTIFYPKDKFEDIHAEIDNLIDDFTMALVDQIEMQKLIGIHLQDEKLVAILFHEQQRSLPYKIISNDDYLEEHIAFFRMKDPKPEVLKQFQIKKLPALIVLMQDNTSKQKDEMAAKEDPENAGKGVNLKIAQYTGHFTYEGLFDYFKNFVRPQKSKSDSTHDYTADQDKNIDLDNQITEIKSAKKFKNVCKSSNCYLLILNNSPENKAKNSQHLKILQKYSGKVSEAVVFIDGVCHSQLIQELQIMEDQLPTLIHINSKFQKYSRMIGRLEDASVATFIKKVSSNKSMSRPYNKININDKNCVEQHEKIRKLINKDVQLSDDEAAIIEQLKKQEEEKRQEFKETVQKDKTRKKGKKRRPKAEDEEL